MSRKSSQKVQNGARHPIQVVVRRTGLSADVLRAWEKRYDVIQPERSDGGRRLYSDEDIEYLRLLRRATEGGRSIGQVAGLSRDTLATVVREDDVAEPGRRAMAPGQERDVVEGALADMVALDARRLHQRLQRAMLDLPAERFLETVATPLLRAIGDGWVAGTLRPSHEHLASAVLLRTLHQFLGAVALPGGGPALVAGTLQGVRHEFGALLAAAAAAVAGWDVTYVGADLPFLELVDAARSRKAEVVAVSMVPPFEHASVRRELAALGKALPRAVTLIVGGAAAVDFAELIEQLGAVRCDDLPSLRSALAAGRGARAV